ncbi:DNA polymerase IV [Sulfurisphaera javensis]|uniref:DNA polymerase IV n=1 Tax=Sulfurisphaera javensis TaxID=2049879 RepID=A0AAT9GS42_9CREN
MIVLFIDFDYFFAQVEEVLNPQYKGKPLVVCVYSGRSERSGAVATANYEARKLGVKAGIPISKAMELAPNAIFLPMRKEVYSKVSKRIMEIIRKYSDKMEIASIDEAYIDITDKVKDFDEALKLGKRLKEEIYQKEKITVSIGIAPNKVFAKIIADKVKPNGLGILKPEEVSDFIRNLDIDEIPGVGKVISEKLHKIGINKLIDILHVPFDTLKKEIGEAKAHYLYKLATNTYFEPVVNKERVPHGRYLTLPKNTRDLKIIEPYLIKAIDEAYKKIDGIPRRITVVTIMQDLDIISKSKTFKGGISKDKAYKESLELLKAILEKDKRLVRRVGVKFDNIFKSKGLEDFIQ